MRWCLIYCKLIGGSPTTGRGRLLITVSDDTNFEMIYLPPMQRHLSCSKSSVLRWPEKNAGAWSKSRPAGQPAAGQDELVRTEDPPSCCKHILLWDGLWNLIHPTMVLESSTQVPWWSHTAQPPKSAFSRATWKLPLRIFKLSFHLRKLRCAQQVDGCHPSVNLDNAWLSSTSELGWQDPVSGAFFGQ